MTDDALPVLRAEFSSDNAAGVHPRMLAAIVAANSGSAFPYGHDEFTKDAEDVVRAAFSATTSRVLFTMTGTGANILALDLLLAASRRMPIVCSDCAHILVDECGAPERILGTKLVPVPAPTGKLAPSRVEEALEAVPRHLRVEPAVLSVTQPTELGTIYSVEELVALRKLCDDRGWLMHMDGARLPNAAAALETSLAAISTEVGVDAVTMGGTKTGLGFGDVVVVFNQDARDGASFLRRQVTQLAPKMRFISVQFRELLSGELWRELATHANAMTTNLVNGIKVDGCRVILPAEINMAFMEFPAHVANRFQETYAVYPMSEGSSILRLMTSWQTTEEQISELAAFLEVSDPGQ